MKKFFFIAIVLVGLLSCNQQEGPEGTLKSFINYRFSESQQKDELLSRTTGVLNEKISAMTDEEFAEFSNSSKYKKKKFKLNLSRCDKNQCFLTYTITYDKYEGDKQTFGIEVKKIAELLLLNGSWKIVDVSNIKTFFDSKQPLEP
jgi:hypothetical protein